MEEVYRIIKIIDDKTVVINAGEKDHIKKGDEFQIYSIGESVIDPETKEDLGTLNTIKEVVSAVDVLPNMSICRHIDVNYYNPFSSMVSPFSTKEVVTNKCLNVETTQITGGLSQDLTIKIGDKVRLIKSKSNEIKEDEK